MFNKRYWRVQSEISECGLASLAICSSILGAELDMGELRRKYHNSQRGVDLTQLISLASALDLQCRPRFAANQSDLQNRFPASHPALEAQPFRRAGARFA